MYSPFSYFGPVASGGASIPQTNLTMWLQADAITGLSNGNNVASWLDSSSNTNPAANASVGSQPVYHTNVLNSLPSVRFTGSQILTSTKAVDNSGSITAGMFFFAVLNSTFAPNTYNYVFDNEYGTNGGPYLLHDNRNHNNTFELANDGSGVPVNWDAEVTNSYTNGSNVILFWGYDPTNGPQYYINNVLQTPLVGNYLGLPPANTPFNPSLAPTLIGNGYGGEGLNGDMFEMGFYSANLNSTDRTTIYNYLHAKWGI